MADVRLEDRYEVIARAGIGVCGEVYKGRDKQSGDVVALKKIKPQHAEGGFPMNSMREIRLLRAVQHENIISLRHIATDRDRGVYLVFDYCEYDLQALLSYRPFTNLQVQCYSRQIFAALEALSREQWMHRDLKPGNILVTAKNYVKLADFGLAKQCDGGPAVHTTKVITIWYRPPELLIGIGRYGTEIDIWSAGCILYEMITQRVLFQTLLDNELQEMEVIFKIHGYPEPDVYELWRQYPGFAPFVGRKEAGSGHMCGCKVFSDFLDSTLPAQSELAKDLLLKMLEYDSSKRISIGDIMLHPFVVKSNEVAIEMLPSLTIAEMHQSKESLKRGKQKKGKVPTISHIVPPEIT
jgi:serine/threonine protein kinase